MSAVLACDLGGSSFRAALIDIEGKTLAEHVVPGPTAIDRMGRSEIDAEDWWSVFREAADALAEAVPEHFATIEAIAICGVTRTQVFLGRDGRQLRPAITWKDTRAAAAAERLRDKLGSHPEASRVNAFHPLARLAWLAEEEEATHRALAMVLEPKDWLNFRLTGRQAGDPVSTARLRACVEPTPYGDALSSTGLPATIVPPALEPCEILGSVQSGLPGALERLAGVPVFCSSSDTWVAVVGLGAMRAGFGYNISGTTEVFGVVGEDAAEADGLLTVDWRGLWQLGGPSQNGADVAAWLVELLGGAERGYAGVGDGVTKLLGLRRHPQPLVFLPYLQGERVPYWNPDLRGAFLGLGRQHGGVDLAYALLEGVAFLNRVVLERAETSLGTPVGEIRFGGGAATNPIWAQIKADVCNRTVSVGSAKEPGLLGAAIVAWTGLGRFPSLAAAQQALVAVGQRYEPNLARRETYDALFEIFRRAEGALAPISVDLAGLSCSAGSLPGIHARHRLLKERSS